MIFKPYQLLIDQFANYNICAYLVPLNNEFNNHPDPLSNHLMWLTNFSGSNGLAIISKTKLAFFTDSRYLIQAKEELTNQWQILNLDPSTINQYLKNNFNLNDKIGYNPWLFTVNQMANYPSNLVAIESDLINLIRQSSCLDGLISILNEDFIDYSIAQKVANIIKLIQMDFEALLITATDSISWLLNIRNHQNPYTPVVFARLLVFRDHQLELYTNQQLASEVTDCFLRQVKIYPLDQLNKRLAELNDKTIIYDPNSLPTALMSRLIDSKPIASFDYCQLPKAQKTNKQLIKIKEANLLDSLAVCQTLCYLDQKDITTNELEIVNLLLTNRQSLPNFMQPSFESIVAFGSNGAIIHYHPNFKTNKSIKANGLLLIDSGAQYLTATTDITRTIAIGMPSYEQAWHFTMVLKGHINLANAKFPKGTTGGQLDVLARYYLWQHGLDYQHSTAHGVGCYLNVHEGPQIIGKIKQDCPLLAGMILSNEPGYYKPNHYGIRIENLMVVREDQLTNFLSFEPLTMVPIDQKLILTNLLSEFEVAWLNDYHQKIYDYLAPKATNSKLLEWLAKSTTKIISGTSGSIDYS